MQGQFDSEAAVATLALCWCVHVLRSQWDNIQGFQKVFYWNKDEKKIPSEDLATLRVGLIFYLPLLPACLSVCMSVLWDLNQRSFKSNKFALI